MGKTELARALAKFLFADASALIRVDMSEYMEKFSVSRLIGAPPGYVGYEDSGTLTKAVRRKPYSVVLLDEIEKAHPDVFNILLQVLDEGHLTDNYGRVIDFKNTVVIMTSNVGAKDITKSRTLGFSNADTRASFEKMSEKVKEELNHTFNPEFLNRLDDVIVFHPLSKEHIAQIVSILLRDVQKRLGDEELTLKLTDAATDFLVKNGFDENYGARPLKRAIQKWIEDPLSEKILLAEFSKGDEIDVDVAADGEKLEFRVLGQHAERPDRPHRRNSRGRKGLQTLSAPFSCYITMLCANSPSPQLALFCAGAPLLAQEAAPEAKCATPDSIASSATSRVRQHDDPARCGDNARHAAELADGAARHQERLRRADSSTPR